MPTLGQGFMYAGLVCGVLAVLFLIVGFAAGRRKVAAAEKLTNAGYLLIFGTALSLTLAIVLLIYCFFVGDYSIAYVAEEHSSNTTSLAWLFKLAGVWAGAQGSLLLWAWLLSIFAAFVAWRRLSETDELSNVALAVMGIVIVAFQCVLIFSSTNNPFLPTDPSYIGDDGSLIGMAAYWGMNVLLEHWAMAIHPPTLFVGYAGLTVPFAYAIAALVVDDPSKRWVELCNRITVFAWLFLGLGIGLGAVWAYVVLGWGGYWGWDAVENASLLPWLVGVALIHSFTVYRKRGGFKRWSVLCACLTFSFVILGTFITRSGIVQSVHAFGGDNVSLLFFLCLILLSLCAGVIGVVVRRRSFAETDEIVSFTGKSTAYYFSNVVMVIMAFIITYLTLSSALPTWLPFGGQALSAGTYNAIARPIGTLYCLLMAVCPLLAWSRTDGADFRRNARWPAIGAVVVFAALLVVYLTRLLPIYQATIAGKGTPASQLLSEGPMWYYNGLAIVALFVAALLFFNTLYLFISGTKVRRASKGESAPVALLHLFTRNGTRAGGYLTHLGVAVMLVGLIGSSMFVREVSVNIPADAGSQIACMEYTLVLEGTDTRQTDIGQVETATFQVYRDGAYLGELAPSEMYVASTQQTKLDASVISFPLEDLFVVYQGASTSGTLSMDVRVNPLISFVWVGFGIMMLGTAVASFGGRRRRDGASADGTVSDPASDGAPADEDLVGVPGEA